MYIHICRETWEYHGVLEKGSKQLWKPGGSAGLWSLFWTLFYRYYWTSKYFWAKQRTYVKQFFEILIWHCFSDCFGKVWKKSSVRKVFNNPGTIDTDQK